MRLDRFLCEMDMGTRSQARASIRQGLVAVNGIPAKSADMKINENADKVTFRGQPLQYRKYVYYMLNKPAGAVSATVDNTADTVVSLLKGELHSKDIFPVGRLDKDATGLLLLTNDGDLAHRLLSPAKHVDKTYRVALEHPVNQRDIERLEAGVDIGEERPTLPARVSVIADDTILLTVHEGRFHQVKRMLLAVGNGVRSLKRISFGALCLDETLKEGEYRELTPEEIGLLQSKEVTTNN